MQIIGNENVLDAFYSVRLYYICLFFLYLFILSKMFYSFSSVFDSSRVFHIRLHYVLSFSLSFLFRISIPAFLLAFSGRILTHILLSFYSSPFCIFLTRRYNPDWTNPRCMTVTDSLPLAARRRLISAVFSRSILPVFTLAPPARLCIFPPSTPHIVYSPQSYSLPQLAAIIFAKYTHKGKRSPRNHAFKNCLKLSSKAASDNTCAHS